MEESVIEPGYRLPRSPDRSKEFIPKSRRIAGGWLGVLQQLKAPPHENELNAERLAKSSFS
jgi:hypothetical protein